MTIKEIFRLGLLIIACLHVVIALFQFWSSDHNVKWDAGKLISSVGIPYLLLYLYNTLS